MSSIYCQKCKQGFLTPENPLANTHENASLWICSQCNEKSSGRFIESTVLGCRNYMNLEGTVFIVIYTKSIFSLKFFAGLDTIVKIENVLNKFKDILSPNHAIILDLKQNLITMYENDNLSSKSFERKLKLCNELIEVLKIIEPEISRLTGNFPY